MVGKSLSHYKITAELGRGGMGIVYKAQDTKLDRTVAIKVLPSAALSSEDDRARFYREAKAAAQLHHPHIASVFEIDEAVPSDAPHGTEPSPFIAMEYIEGETLHDHIQQSPLKIKEAVRIGREIASALEAAHEKGIVHRDIKSANVMLTSKGSAKVLDFGLAQTAASTKLTRMGSTLGTVAYMSPEQARGEEVDLKTDLWSLGAVLYEMIAGRSPFPGDYEQAVVYEILNQEPEPLTAVRTGVPMELEAVINKCLAKDPEYRYPSASGLIVDLKRIEASSSVRTTSVSVLTGAISAPATVPIPRSGLPWMIISAFVVVSLVAGIFLGTSFFAAVDDTPGLIRKYSMELSGLTGVFLPDISPDGKWMVVGATDSLGWEGGFRIELETGTVERIVGTESGGVFKFSPDGDRLLFRASNNNIYVIPAVGGSAVEVVKAATGIASWHPDGSILYGVDAQIWRVDASGDNPVQVSFPDSTSGEVGHYNPRALPDRRHVLMHVSNSGAALSIAVLDLDSGLHKMLGPGSNPVYVPSGHVLYFDGQGPWSGQLLARPFDLNSLEFTGATVSITASSDISTFAFDQYGTFFSNFNTELDVLENNEALFYKKSESEASFQLTELSGVLSHFRLSPNGKEVAAIIDFSAADDYVLVINRETRVQLQINFSGDADYMAWSADGTELFLEVDSQLEVFSPTGSGRIRSYTTAENLSNFDVSPDGSFIIYVSHPGRGSGSLRMLSLEDSTDVSFYEGLLANPRISPDGNYVAFHDSQFNVYVKEILGDGLYLASRDVSRARRPVWSPDGNFLYFDAEPNRLVRIPISLENGFSQLSRPEELSFFSREFEMDISEDGEIVVLTSGSPGTETLNEQQTEFVTFRYDVTVNWFEELKTLAPQSE